MPDRLCGTVKWFNEQRGFGFITRDEGQGEVFVHWTGIVMEGFRKLVEGQRVTFVIETSEKGPKAVAVEIVRPAESIG